MDLKLESLEDLMRISHLYKLSVVMHFALSHDLFELLGQQRRSVEELASDLRCQPEKLAILLNILVGISLLRLDAGKFENTPLSLQYLTKSRRTKMSPLMLYLMKTGLTNAAISPIIGAVPEQEAGGDEENARYMEAMDSGNKLTALKAARMLAKRCKGKSGIRLLDAGCGSGIFSIEACKFIPGLSVDAVDRGEILEFTRRKLTESGMDGRIALQERDLSQLDFAGGENYDFILLSNVLHFFPEEEIRRMLVYCHSSLKPGGALIINDIFADLNHLDSLFYSLEWLSNQVCFPDQDALSHMLVEAGFWRIEAEKAASTQSSIIFAEKRVVDEISYHP